MGVTGVPEELAADHDPFVGVLDLVHEVGPVARRDRAAVLLHPAPLGAGQGHGRFVMVRIGARIDDAVRLEHRPLLGQHRLDGRRTRLVYADVGEDGTRR